MAKTHKARQNKKCNVCGADLVCPKCKVPSKVGTPFSLWLREVDMPVSCHDIDYVWHNYEENWYVTLEEKTHSAAQSLSQKETQGIVFQMLRSSSPHLCLTQKGWKEIEYRGHHVIQLTGTTPCDGDIYLDGVKVDEAGLLKFLQTGKTNNETINQSTK